jgi:secondary thiamine-phosphate synthase enzyme
VLTKRLTVDTRARRAVDVTDVVGEFAASAGGDGLLVAFLPHATCGLALIETGAGSEADLEAAIDRLLPREGRYGHRHGSPGHGADHVLPAFIAPSLAIPIQGGRPQFGTWQSVVIVDPNQDNNERTLHLSFLRG